MPGLSDFLAKLGFTQKPPQQAPTGAGMAQHGMQTIDARQAYTQYAIDRQSSGMPAVPFPEFVQGRR